MKLHAARNKLRHMKQKTRRTEQRATTSKRAAAADKANDPNAELQMQWKKGRQPGLHGKQFTKQGQMALAVRRSLSNIAAKDLGSVLLTDVSGTSINRYEVELAAALTASSQQFHLHNEERFNHHTGGWNVAFHAFRSDATNSSVWQRSKIMVADLLSAYVYMPNLSHDIDDANHKSFGSMLSMHHGWCELQRVGDSSAVGRLMLLSQNTLRSVVCMYVQYCFAMLRDLHVC